MNTPFHPLSLSLFGVTLCLLAEPADARPSCESCHSDCNGQIITLNPDTGRSLSADVFAFEKQAAASGAKPESCIRPQHCQDQLYYCYNACGQRGRAAKHSKHTDGMACDFSPNYSRTLSRLRRQYPNMDELRHSQSQGGGLHDYTHRWVASNGSTAPNKVPAKVPPPRAPASTGASAQQDESGRYRCASGMRSICGSTKDTPWCRQWIASGHTPGCFN